MVKGELVVHGELVFLRHSQASGVVFLAFQAAMGPVIPCREMDRIRSVLLQLQGNAVFPGGHLPLLYQNEPIRFVSEHLHPGVQQRGVLILQGKTERHLPRLIGLLDQELLHPWGGLQHADLLRMLHVHFLAAVQM